MTISNNYIVVERTEEEKKEGGFEVKAPTDSFLYKGNVLLIPEMPVYMGNQPVKIGDTVMFAKYSPDTHEQEINGKKVKFISTRDILAVL